MLALFSQWLGDLWKLNIFISWNVQETSLQCVPAAEGFYYMQRGSKTTSLTHLVSPLVMKFAKWRTFFPAMKKPLCLTTTVSVFFVVVCLYTKSCMDVLAPCIFWGHKIPGIAALSCSFLLVLGSRHSIKLRYIRLLSGAVAMITDYPEPSLPLCPWTKDPHPLSHLLFWQKAKCQEFQMSADGLRNDSCCSILNVRRHSLGGVERDVVTFAAGFSEHPLVSCLWFHHAAPCFLPCCDHESTYRRILVFFPGQTSRCVWHSSFIDGLFFNCDRTDLSFSAHTGWSTGKALLLIAHKLGALLLTFNGCGIHTQK